MKKLVATAPRVAELKDYEDREIKSNEVKVKVEFASPKHEQNWRTSAEPHRL